MTAIPIENIYFLLCYAWNKLDEKGIVNVNQEEHTTLLDLFAKVLVKGVNRLLKIGFDRNYIFFSEKTRCLKGKIDFSATIKGNLLKQAKLVCVYDEFSFNVLHNQIIKYILRLLINNDSLDQDIKKQLIVLIRYFKVIDDIILRKSMFKRVQLHSNNYFYDFLLKICELIFDYTMIDENTGNTKFREFIEDENKMAMLFESFVRNFYRIELKGARVDRENIDWDLKSENASDLKYLPIMQTDVSILYKGRKIIIDTKFYKECLQTKYDKETIISTNLYQLFSYLKNIEKKGGLNETCDGILLYPVVKKELDLKYSLETHNILIKTINLNQNWKQIHDDLLNMVL